jgi:hypothetical protein
VALENVWGGRKRLEGTGVGLGFDVGVVLDQELHEGKVVLAGGLRTTCVAASG